jgi:REP element-mobilizing transposase RayT
MIRGIERRKIFRDNEDREDFLNRLEKLLPETQTACYAWVFIANHAHFLFRTGTVPLATLMRRLLTGYAVSFNRRHERHGQLFQNRYKSIVCQEEVYLRELVRYIHLNPLRTGIVSNLTELNEYPYCGHSALMERKKRSWQDVDYVLRYFGKTSHNARKAYLSYVEAGLEQGRRDELTGGGLIRSLGGWSELSRLRLSGHSHVKSDERILGESGFVDSVLSQAGEKYDRQYELIRRGYDLDRIAERVSVIYEMDPDEIFTKGKQQRKVQARSLFCFWAVQELGISLTELAKHLGITVPGVGYAVERGRAIARDNNYQLIE